MTIPRFIRYAPAAVVAAIAIAGAVLISPGGANAQASTLNLLAGDGEVGYSVNAFLPAAVTVTTGDTIVWDFVWPEPHSVTFGQPTGDPSVPTHPGQSVVDYDGTGFVSSGLIFGDGEFGMRFTQPGSYSYVCIIHPFMTGTVNVVDSGDTTTQAEADAEAASVYASRLAAIKSVAAQVGASAGAITPKPDGTDKFSLVAGAANQAGDDAMQFFPAAVNIGLGDTIEWTSSIPVPHTVTFGPFPGGDPFEEPVTKPGDTFDGTGYWSSGVIGQDFPNGTKFEMTFSKAGSFEYYCILHEPQGMVGTVNVATAGSPTATPKPPTAGAGVQSADGGGESSALWIALAGMVIITAGSGMLWRATRRA